MLKAVIFDVDFTLARPGPELGPEGYREVGKRFGLDLDPSLYDPAREAAFLDVKAHPELDHDEEIWVLFTERIIVGMGGVGDTYAAAQELERGWTKHHHFDLYDDVDVLAELRRRGLKIGLLSNSARDMGEFIEHHGLEVDAYLTSFVHGKIKPHDSIFHAMLAQLDISADEAVMVGDALTDDIEGARGVGMRAILVDREGRHRDEPDRIETLRELAALLASKKQASRKRVATSRRRAR